MESRTSSKLKILYIVDILSQHSDEEHPLNATEICDHLEKYGIKAERKAIYDDINNLISYGFDIISTRTPKSGYFLASRDFELPEIYLLIDAVQSADFITAKKTRELVSKLEKMMSQEQAKRRERSTYIEYKNKCDNEEIYIVIDALRSAIEHKKKVNLKYLRRSIESGRQLGYTAKEFTVSPYALVWQDDHYYLICNNEKYDNLMHLRLDKMKGVTELKESARYYGEVCEYTDVFNTADYVSKTFNMFGGELVEIKLKCKRTILEQIIDRFGDKIFLVDVNDDSFSFYTKGRISEGLIGWILQFGDDVEVISPESLRERIVEKITLLHKTYKKD